MSVCALCEERKPLMRSHVIPEFVYAPCYNANFQMSGITGRGPLGRKLIQQGIRERLLCAKCEAFLNDNYEAPFKRYWFDRKPLPAQIPAQGVTLTDIDYRPFKLFHLSVLFRCGVATSPMFSEIDLGLHRRRLRRLITNRDPGRPDQYPIFARAFINRGVAEWRIVGPPFPAQINGLDCCGVIFAGCAWFYGLSTRAPHRVLTRSLEPNGSLHIMPEQMAAFPIMQKASVALRAKKGHSE